MTEEQHNKINSKKRCAAMTKEQLSEINRKRRETYHRKKAESMLSKVSKGNCIHYEIVQIQFPFFVQLKCIICCASFLQMARLHPTLKPQVTSKMMIGYTGMIRTSLCKLIKRI